MGELITKELLKSWNPCADGYKRFLELFPNGATLQEALDGLVLDGHDDWGWWLFNACRRNGIFLEVTALGYRNSGDRNSGHFNVDTPSVVRVFGKDCDVTVWERAYKPSFLYFTQNEWVPSGSLSEQEKTEHPLYEVTGGILRRYEYKEAFQRSWEKADHGDRMRIKDLPNFDAEIFFQISGIDLRER